MYSIKIEKFKSLFFIILIMSTELISNIGAVDKIGPQWLYLSVITLIGFFTTKDLELKKLNNIQTIIYFLFVFFCFISVFFSVNKIESTVYFSRIVLIFFCYLFFVLSKFESKTILFVLFGFFAIEGLAIFIQFIEVYEFGSFFGRNSTLIGVSSNINIAGFSIALLYPFAIQFYNKKGFYYRIFAFVVILISSFSIILTGSRGAILSMSIAIFGCVFYYSAKEKQFMSRIKKIIFIISPFLLTVFISEILFKGGLNYTNRIEQIVTRGSSSRLAYYKDVVSSFKEKPFTGVGIGNWKLNSIKEGKRHIEGYIVPYHAHNDFLQILAETGIFGFLFYVGIFIYILYVCFKNFIRSNILFSCSIFLIIYLLDANLNFPIARPMMQIKLALVFALILKNDK